MSRYNNLDNVEVKKCTKCNNTYRVYDDSEYSRVSDIDLKTLLNSGNSIRLKGKCPYCKGIGNDVKVHVYFFCTIRGHRVNMELCELRREQKSYGCMSCKIYKSKIQNTDHDKKIKHESKKIYKVNKSKEAIIEKNELINNVDEKIKKRKYNKKSNNDKKIKSKNEVTEEKISEENVKKRRGRPKGSKNKK